MRQRKRILLSEAVYENLTKKLVRIVDTNVQKIAMYKHSIELSIKTHHERSETASTNTIAKQCKRHSLAFL